jgi:hypothetical protein
MSAGRPQGIRHREEAEEFWQKFVKEVDDVNDVPTPDVLRFLNSVIVVWRQLSRDRAMCPMMRDSDPKERVLDVSGARFCRRNRVRRFEPLRGARKFHLLLSPRDTSLSGQARLLPSQRKATFNRRPRSTSRKEAPRVVSLVMCTFASGNGYLLNLPMARPRQGLRISNAGNFSLR